MEQLGNAIVFTAFYTTIGIGTTGLTVTCSVYNPAGTLVVNAVAATSVGLGIYQYTLVAGSVLTEGEYKGIFHTVTTTVDQQDLADLQPVGRAGVEYLDVAISSRLAPTVVGRTLDVAATGEAGLDFDNIHDATGAHTLTNLTMPVTTAVTNVVSANLTQILGAVITGTAAYLVASFTKFFNVQVPTGTINSLPDAVPGLTSGLFIAGTNAATTITTALTTNISGSVGSIATSGITAASFAAGAIDAAAIKDAAIDKAAFAADIKTGDYLNVQVKGQDNIDFGALQKSSLNAATPASTGSVTNPVTVGTNNDKTGYGLSATAVDDVWNEALAGHLGVGTVGAKLNSLCCTLGSGSVSYSYTITDSVSGLPIPDVTVTVTSDVAGLVVIAQGLTDPTGLVTFWLDPGNYWFWNSKSGYNFTNPDHEVVV